MDCCGTCCGKGYLGLKARESPLGMDSSRPCTACGGTGKSGVASSKPCEYRIITSRGRTLEQMVESGRYDYANGDINSANFPKPPRDSGETLLELVRFGRGVTTAEAEAELTMRGLLLGDVWELTAFGSAFPDIQRQFLIIALGSFLAEPLGCRLIPYLYGNSGYRELELYFVHPVVKWGISCQFLAVRKGPHALGR